MLTVQNSKATSETLASKFREHVSNLMLAQWHGGRKTDLKCLMTSTGQSLYDINPKTKGNQHPPPM